MAKANAALVNDDDLGWPSDISEWVGSIRPQAMHRFTEIYGRTPDVQVQVSTEILREHEAIGGRASLRQTAVTLVGPAGDLTFTVVVVAPRDFAPRGTLLGLNFRGNHAITFDDQMLLCDGSDPRTGVLHYENAEFRPMAARGSLMHRWPLDSIVDQGFAVATACYLQFGPDSRGVFETGPHHILGDPGERSQDRWGALGIWAWGLSRVLDLLLEARLMAHPCGPVYAFGHSRMGKTALWAAAQDERFAGAIANQSGAMGAALSRPVGETPLLLAQVRPYWFSPHFNEAVKSGHPLRVDQHHLLACLAPRHLLVGSAQGDHHADPEGEYLSIQRASRVWSLYEHENRVHHHMRQGEHELLAEDWGQYLKHLICN